MESGIAPQAVRKEITYLNWILKYPDTLTFSIVFRDEGTCFTLFEFPMWTSSTFIVYFVQSLTHNKINHYCQYTQFGFAVVDVGR